MIKTSGVCYKSCGLSEVLTITMYTLITFSYANSLLNVSGTFLIAVLVTQEYAPDFLSPKPKTIALLALVLGQHLVEHLTPIPA